MAGSGLTLESRRWQDGDHGIIQGIISKSVPLFFPMMEIGISKSTQRRGFAPFR
jgi:hypothetical protein